jgi:hypothetical protein
MKYNQLPNDFSRGSKKDALRFMSPFNPPLLAHRDNLSSESCL